MKRLIDKICSGLFLQITLFLMFPVTGLSESFEKVKVGPFTRLETSIGTWQSVAGLSIIDDRHALTGTQCLHITGGAKSSVTLLMDETLEVPCRLSFRAERWTRREPFAFRIEKHSGDGWDEIFNGDDQVKVGRGFLSTISLPLNDPDIKRLRFNVTSPPDTGLLLDDVSITPSRPQRVVNAETIPFTLPALVGVDASPLLKLAIQTEGNLNPVILTELGVTLTCEEEDVESVMAYFGGANHSFTEERPFGQSVPVSTTSGKSLVFAGNQSLLEGVNVVWIACKLRADAGMDHRIGATLTHVMSSKGDVDITARAPSLQRLGVALRRGGDDGVHTYRIPGLATTKQGTLIGVYDIRRRSGGDLPGDIDVGMSRSTDGGHTWEAMKVIMDMGNDPDWRYDGIGDPAVLVDRETGTIWVAATWSHGNRSWVGSGPGLNPEETGQLMLVRSDDDGVTWSEPFNITRQVKQPEWSFILQGPGKGITMRDGTLVFAAQYQDPPNPDDQTAHRLPHSTILYSKDHGSTWHAGTGALDDTTEAQVIEIEPGVLMLNCRYNRGSVRAVMTTDDMGRTWKKHASSELALIEPRACMASLIDVDQELGNNVGGWLLFSNPDSISGRHHITIKASSDRGLTWPKAHQVLLDEGESAGYSCMSMIDEQTVGILYEGSQSHLTFQRIPMTDIIGVH